jgi:hypothetical protein
MLLLLLAPQLLNLADQLSQAALGSIKLSLQHSGSK